MLDQLGDSLGVGVALQALGGGLARRLRVHLHAVVQRLEHLVGGAEKARRQVEADSQIVDGPADGGVPEAEGGAADGVLADVDLAAEAGAFAGDQRAGAQPQRVAEAHEIP